MDDPRKGSLALLLGLFMLLGACVSYAGADVGGGVMFGYETQAVVNVPYDIYTYPHVVYRGRPAYLYRSRWYYDSPRGWVLFRREPEELARQRARYDQDRRYVTPPVEEERYRRRY